MQLNKTSVERIIELNQIVKGILYQNSKIDFDLMKKYTNEIYCISNNLVKLGFLEWSYNSDIDTIEFEFKWPTFLNNAFKPNIFYLFPKIYEFQLERETFGDEYISIFVEGISSYEDYYNSL